MTNKPPKHSELKKQAKKGTTAARWAQDAWTGNRSKVRMIAPQRYLIVTEGEKTEPLYFRAIKKRIDERFGKSRIDLDIQPGCSNTIDLLNKAREKVEKSPNGYDRVWIVYDKDDFPSEHFNKVQSECRKTEPEAEEGEVPIYKAAWSNQSFELWYVLHFEYMHSAAHRKDYVKKLTGHLVSLGHGKYKKSRTDMFDILEDYVDNAIRNAKMLEEKNAGKTPSESEPGTTVHHLIEEMLPYIRE